MPITPNDPADFGPTLGNYTELKPFRYWCQKVLPLVYDDSLSYYELLCKVVDYLNKTMEDVETLHGDVTNLHTAYEELQSYVNDYFSTLDVQEEINNKLNQMASDGSLTALISPLLPNIIDEWLESNITPTSPPLDSTFTLENAAGQSKSIGDKCLLSQGNITGDSDVFDLNTAKANTIYGILNSAISNDKVLNYPFELGGMVVTESGIGVEPTTQIVYPYRPVNSLSAYRTKIDGEWTEWIFSEFDVMPRDNVTSVITNILNNRKYCKLSSGNFVFNHSIEMPEGSTIEGCGESTVITVPDSIINGLKLVDGCCVKNLKMVGSLTNISENNEKSLIVALRTTPNTERKKIKIENVVFEKQGYGVWLYYTGYNTDQGGIINCEFRHCYYGIYFDNLAEYYKVIGCTITNNQIGVVINGGNNYLIGCTISSNIKGIFFDGDGLSNTLHGGVIGCTINHSGEDNDGIGIDFSNGVSGFIFMGNNIFYSAIKFKNISGINFCNNNGNNCNMVIEGDGGVLVKNNIFSSYDITAEGTGYLIEDNYYRNMRPYTHNN